MTMKSNISSGSAETLEQVEQRLQVEMTKRVKRERRAKTFHPILLTVALFLLWEYSVNVFAVPTYLLPAPSLILLSIYQFFGLLMEEAVVSAIEILLGFGMSVVLGIPLAIAIYQWPSFRIAIYPLFVSAQAVPKVAVAPLFIVGSVYETYARFAIAAARQARDEDCGASLMR